MIDLNKKILLVEDSKNYVFILTETLRDAGFTVITAKDGQEGLEAAKNEKPDLIISDITMPEMDGIEMSKKLREANIKVPIIFLTNMGDRDHILEAMDTSTDYIVKADTSDEDMVARVKEKLRIK